MAPPAAFAGFRPAAFSFFRGLAKHNDPLWFKPRKAIYDNEVLAPFRALMTALSVALEAVGVPLVGDPARGIFRLYRDVRFSANKQLYKTHQGAVLTRSGGKGDPGLLYVHCEPGASMKSPSCCRRAAIRCPARTSVSAARRAASWRPEAPLSRNSSAGRTS
jgi:uncharacterized protein (TIGR02453 family)